MADPNSDQELKVALPPKGLATVGWLVVLFWGLGTARAFLIPISIAALLAFMMSPLVKALRRKHVPEWVALSLAALLLLLPFAGIIYGIVMQGQKLVHDFPSILASFERTVSHLAENPWAQKLGLSKSALGLESLTAKVGSGAGKGLAVVVGGLSLILDASSETVLILIFSILMVASRAHLRRSAEKIISRVRSLQGPRLLDEVTFLIQRFLVARIMIVAMIGAVDFIVLKGFSVDYSFLLGAFCGVMTLVPNIGFILALLPILIVSLATGHSGGSVLGMTVVLVVVSFIEGNVLSPKLVGQRLNINTLTSFVGFFAGGLLWGVWGMLLSVPLLGVLRISFSAIPSLQPWGDLLAEKEDHSLANPVSLRKNKAAA